MHKPPTSFCLVCLLILVVVPFLLFSPQSAAAASSVWVDVCGQMVGH